MIPAIDKFWPKQEERIPSLQLERASYSKISKIVWSRNVVECAQYSHANFANFVCFLYYVQEFFTTFEPSCINCVVRCILLCSVQFSCIYPVLFHSILVGLRWRSGQGARLSPLRLQVQFSVRTFLMLLKPSAPLM